MLKCKIVCSPVELRKYPLNSTYHIGFGVVLVVSVVPPKTGNPFHQADDDVVQGSVQVDYVEDRVMTEIMLQPTSLSLVGGEQGGRRKERKK